jgi:hypothetical protein
MKRIVMIVLALGLGGCGYHWRLGPAAAGGADGERRHLGTTPASTARGLVPQASDRRGVRWRARLGWWPIRRRPGRLERSGLDDAGRVHQHVGSRQFQGIVQISFRLVDRATKRVIYENKLLQESHDFGAVSDVVVTTSPRFQRGTIDARDLAQMTNDQLGEARRRESLTELVDLLARDVYLQSMEGF